MKAKRIKIDKRGQKNNIREKTAALIIIDNMIQDKKKVTISQLLELRGKVSKL